jgi:hypothetical protein
MLSGFSIAAGVDEEVVRIKDSQFARHGRGGIAKPDCL